MVLHGCLLVTYFSYLFTYLLVQARRWSRNSSLRSSIELTRTRKDTRSDRFVNFKKTFKLVNRHPSQQLNNLLTFVTLCHTINPVVFCVPLASLSCTCPGQKIDFARHAFSSAAPQIWNHIPTAIRVSPSLDCFKRHLKTHYFYLANSPPSEYPAPLFRPPVYGSNGRSYKMLVMFTFFLSFFLFFRHAFSEFPRPIALKLCHMVGICVYFIMQVQKLGGHSPKTKQFGGQKHAKFRLILDHFRL